MASFSAVRNLISGAWFARFALIASAVMMMLPASALSQRLGDLDEDGKPSVSDIVRLINHLNRTAVLAENLAHFADVDQNGFINETDANLIAEAILGSGTLPDMPPNQIRETSPANGEGDVAVTRETVIRFVRPLAASSMIGTNHLYAEFGGRRLLSRIELASDRHKVTLFYLEPLPGNARIRVTFRGDGLTDFLNRPLDADGDGRDGGAALIDFDTLSLTPIEGTAVIGRVFASELAPGAGNTSVNRPLGGVTITVEGNEENLRTVTDGQGNFRLEPAPVGRFFVMIDGRTATNTVPPGAYYPFVGKAWDGGAGQVTLAGGSGEIFLPLIAAGTLQAASPIQETKVTFPSAVLQKNPELAGVEISVPANALFSDNGVRGGMVGIAPVPPDRLPEPLPPGLNFPLVITVQTDGPGNFDRPVPVRFPNLAVPATGGKLPPGSKSALWSFNHDTGRWEIVGSMTVTADGRFVESDPGVGILAPGWHGTQPGVVIRDALNLLFSPPPLTCQEIVDILKADCESKMGTAAEGLACQIACIAEISCDNEDSFGGGFVKFTFQSIAANRLRGPSSQYELSVEGLARMTPANQEVIPVLLSSGDFFSVLGGFGYHFPDELFPGFVKYCLRVKTPEDIRKWDADHEAFFQFAVVPCFDEIAGISFLGRQVAKASVPLAAGLTRKVVQALCPLINPAYPKVPGAVAHVHRAQPALRQLPSPLTKEQLFSPPLAAVSTLRVEADNQFFLPVGSTVQLRVSQVNADGSATDLTAAATGTKYYAMVGDGSVNVSSNGLLSISGTSSPVTPITPSLFVVAINGLEVGIGQFAITDVDTDGDLIVDSFERKLGLNPNAANNPASDLDGDGLNDLFEALLFSNPNQADSDGDGLDDHTETMIESGLLDRAGLPLAPSQGQLHFAFQNLDTGFVLRGTTSSAATINNVILAPANRYRLWVLQPKTLLINAYNFVTHDSGSSLKLPPLILSKSFTPDTDNDGLANDIEFIVGTQSTNPDTDGDGISDGAEIEQGTNPLDGKAVRTGILNSIDTPGSAVDICALNDLAIVADSERGVTILNVFNGITPTVIAQVDTPGTARAVSCSGNLIAVADDTGGLAIVDITDPPAARILHQIRLGGAAQAVTAAGSIAYVGLSSGQLVSVEMASGTELDRITLAGAVQDILIGGDTLYVLTPGTLSAIPLDESKLRVVGSVASPGNVGPSRSRLFATPTVLFASHIRGYNVFSLNNPLAPVLLAQNNTTQFGWRQIIANGSGLGIAAVGVNSSEGDISLFNLGPSGTTNRFVSTLTTPGVATALTLYNGLAYIADGQPGVQIINYLPFDAQGSPPTISLATSFAVGLAEEGKLMRVTANASDDVQVRNVEFYVDGIKAATDGNFPFEHRLVTPLIRAQRQSISLRARASDTGGNSTWSDELLIQLVPDATPPSVVRVIPALGTIAGSVNTLAAYFDEPISISSLIPNAFRLIAAGSDQIFGSADDSVMTQGTISYRENLNAAFLVFAAELPAGSYRALVGPPIADLRGNVLAGDVSWTFRVFDRSDADRDGVPDELETSLGLDPFNSDTNGNGILDGAEDFDRDGLSNAGEVIMGTDARNARSVNPAVLDGDLDRDGDSLSDGRELAAGTNPFVADSDGDSWNDEAEVTAASDPLDSRSRPRLLVVGRPPASVVLPSGSGEFGFALGLVVARPPVAVVLPSAVQDQVLTFGLAVARPPVSVVLPGAGNANELTLGTVVARPPVQARIGQ